MRMERKSGRSARRARSGVKRSVVIAGQKTSISLEDAFWQCLKKIADDMRMTPSGLVETIDFARRHDNLSSAIRLFVLDHYRAMQAVRTLEREEAERPSQ
jgi:predicted DNA-binding ribbon-helix-helix protein